MEASKRNHEVSCDEFSKAKFDQNQNVINAFRNKVQELQHEINCMHDSRDFKVAESVLSGPLSNVPCESALFPPQGDQGGLLGRARSMPPNFLDTHGTSGNVFASSPVYPSTSCPRIPTPCADPNPGRISVRASTGQLVLEKMVMQEQAQYQIRDF